MNTIGKFQVLEKIGEGGFGVIYKGLDPHIKRHVAIKSCTSEDQEIRSRFAHEAQIAGNLHHRHIVTVYDFGLQEGVPYLVQEYLSGEDLDRKIKRRDAIPFPQRLAYLVQVARGLEYAHSQGVIHRDIKPANVRILQDGTAKIMDFGIAKLANQETGLTQTGMTLGTAAYLAPEQIQGLPVDPRTDIFSYGVMAYELLSYQRPFSGQHISTVLYQILNDRPRPLREVAPDLPPGLDALVMRCLEKDPAARYGECGELLRDLDALLRSRRGEPSAVGGLAAADVAATEARTRRLAVGSTVVPPPSAPDRRPLPGEIDELELDAGAAHGHTPRSISTTQAMQHRGFTWGRWVVLAVAAMAVVAAVAAWLADRPGGSVAEERIAGLADEAQGEAPAGPLGVGAEASLPREPGADGRPPGAVDGDAPAASDAAAAAEAPAVVEEAEAEAEPPPPPAPARLTVTGWSPDLRATVAGRTYLLGGAQSVELPPGSYEVRFELDTTVQGRSYRDSARRTVRLEPGGQSRLEAPIPRPGVLQVQPHLGTPQGSVVVDGEAVGNTPLHLPVRPGPHVLIVRRASDADGAPLEQPVEVVAGERVAVTFDLTGRRPVELRRSPLD